MVVYWRRIDAPGIERLAISAGSRKISVVSTVISAADGGFQIAHDWTFTPNWRTRSVRLKRLGPNGSRGVTLERDGYGWMVDGNRRSDLDGADEPDLSVTPFCNTLPIRRLLARSDQTLTIDVAYINGEDLTVSRSRQRYSRSGPERIRYFDLGLFSGFEAELVIDREGLVERYEGLFERVKVFGSD